MSYFDKNLLLVFVCLLSFFCLLFIAFILSHDGIPYIQVTRAS